MYVDLTGRIEGLIKDLLRSEGIDVIQVEARTKTVESFVEKINRKGGTGDTPFESITDLVGIRIITYYVEDVTAVQRLLESQFAVDTANSDDKMHALAADQFGYRSTHLVCKLSPSRSKLVEWRAYDGMSVEIQVRTALQHAWAAVSHKLDYKTAQEVPESLRRRLHRLSALFELADEQFGMLRDHTEAASNAYRAEVGRGELDVPLDGSSLAAYWSLTDRLGRVTSVLKGVGAIIQSDEEVGEERLKEDHADLVTILRKFGITTLAALDEYLADEQRIANAATALNSATSETFEGSIEDLLTQVVIVDKDDSEEPGRPPYTAAASAHFAEARARLRAG